MVAAHRLFGLVAVLVALSAGVATAAWSDEWGTCTTGSSVASFFGVSEDQVALVHSGASGRKPASIGTGSDVHNAGVDVDAVFELGVDSAGVAVNFHTLEFPGAAEGSGYLRIGTDVLEPGPADNTRPTPYGNDQLLVCANVMVREFEDAQLLADEHLTQVFGHAQNGASRALGFERSECNEGGAGGPASRVCSTHRWVAQAGNGVKLMEQDVVRNRWQFMCVAWDAAAQQGLGNSTAYFGSSSSTGEFFTATGTTPPGNDFATLGATDLSTVDGTTGFVFFAGAVSNLVVITGAPPSTAGSWREKMVEYRNCFDADGDSVVNEIDMCAGVWDPTNANSDADALGDACDNCPFVTNPTQADHDSDGVGSLCDNCMWEANTDQADDDSDGVGNTCEIPCDDADSDGVCANKPAGGEDNCADDANPTQSDVDSDGVGDACDGCINAFNPAQLDGDSDGTQDACDNCEFDENQGQIDTDSDGLGDECDNCEWVANGEQWDGDSDGVGLECDNCEFPLLGKMVFNPMQNDTDSDGFGDECDNCIDVANADQRDDNSDGQGNACFNCEDVDMDTVCTNCPELAQPTPADECVIDNCPDVPNPGQEDADMDGVGDLCDNCPEANPDQADNDSDGFGNVCDGCPDDFAFRQEDSDSDGRQDPCDNCPDTPNAGQEDGDSDGQGDACEGDFVVTNVCKKVWQLRNTRDTDLLVRFDWRPTRTPRFSRTVNAQSTELIVFDRHGASKEVLYLYEHVDSDVAVEYQNTRRGQECLEVTPVCRNRFQVWNRASVALPIAFRNGFDAATSADPDVGMPILELSIDVSVTVDAGELRVVETSNSPDPRDKFEIWLRREPNIAERKEGTFLSRYLDLCPSPGGHDQLPPFEPLTFE